MFEVLHTGYPFRSQVRESSHPMALPPVRRRHRNNNNAYLESSYNSVSRLLSSFTRMVLRIKYSCARRRLEGLNLRISSSTGFSRLRYNYYGSMLLGSQATDLSGPRKKRLPLPVLSPIGWYETAKSFQTNGLWN